MKLYVIQTISMNDFGDGYSVFNECTADNFKKCYNPKH